MIVSALYVAGAAAQAVPASATWARLDVGIGLPSIVIVCIFIGACAAVLRDRVTHSGALFGVFFTALITTIAAMRFVVGHLVPDPASQAVAGMFMAYNAQRWAGKFTEKFLKSGDAQDRRQGND